MKVIILCTYYTIFMTMLIWNRHVYIHDLRILFYDSRFISNERKFYLKYDHGWNNTIFFLCLVWFYCLTLIIYQ